METNEPKEPLNQNIKPEDIKEVKQKNYVAIYAILALLVVAAVAGTYAFFALRITGNPTEDTITVGAARMAVQYTDGAAVTGNYILPGWTDSKEVKVTNTGNREVKFDLVWQSLTNEFIETVPGTPELVYEATCSSVITTDGVPAAATNCAGFSQKAVPTDITGNDKYLFDDVPLVTGEERTYTITFTLLDFNYEQNNQANEFHGFLNATAGGTDQYTDNNPTAEVPGE